MSLSVQSKSHSAGERRQVRHDSSVDKKEQVAPSRPSLKPQEPQQEESRVREDRDVYETKPRLQALRDTVRPPDTVNTFWEDTGREQDKAIQQEAKNLWKSELGRDIPDAEASRLAEQARQSGAINPGEARAYFQKMIQGSPEKAALNHVGAEFQRLLGRELSVPEQQSWVKGSGLDVNSSRFATDATARIQASDEYRARNPGSPPAAPAMSPDEAFITQFFTPKYNPNGPNGSTNCGPTSLAISMNYTGRMPPGLSKEQQVDHARALMNPHRQAEYAWTKDQSGNRVPLLDRDHELTGGSMEQDGIAAAGGTAQFGKGWAALDKALEKGPVLGNGWYGEAWRQQFPSGDTGRTGPNGVGHVNAILGKTAEGKYLVADPMHRQGVVEMSREQLSVFFQKKGGEPSFAATNFGATAPTAPSTPPAPSAALEGKLTSAPPPATPAPQGAYEQAVASAIANAPKNNAQLREHWANFAADHVAPRLEALGVPREKIQQAILWGLTEGTATVGTNSKYRMENGAPSSAITYSNLGDNAQINGSTQTPSGLKADGTPFKYWQVGIAGVQVKEAVKGGWLKDAFEKLYPGQTPQQVGQRMLDLMGETNDKTFPNLTMDQLTQMNGDTMVNGKWAAILLRDPAINVLSMTRHGNLDHWLGVNRDRLEKEAPGFYASLVSTVNKAFN